MVAEQPALSFAGLLRQLRAEAGLTQEELAEAAGVGTRSVSDLERGVHASAHKDTAGLLARALGLPESARELFVAAARGKAPAAEVLAARHAEAPGGSAAAGGGAAGAHGFTLALTSFVGRADQLAEVEGLLGECRLVTVTGPGGMGKTRLAGEVARRVANRFADGVWLAELAGLSDPALVSDVVAGALGLRLAPGVPLTEALAGRQLLLVLDNCEHLDAAAGELCKSLLLAADDVQVLATSREPLGVPGEARYRLPPLALPAPGGAAGIADSEAVALFADRARRADRHFRLDAESGLVAGRIVARLDGMPLAIELAAARVEALGLQQLLDRLDDRFRLLVGGERWAEARHRSLAAAVDWSYRLLSEPERRVFRAVSVFPGPFTLEGAEAVADTDASLVVLHLVDCSLLAAPQEGADGRARYLMLETLRAFGAERLAEAGERDAVAAAMARYALAVAEQAAAGLRGSTGEPVAMRWLDAEAATVHQALAWGLQHDPGLAAQIAVALAPWWILSGRQAAGYQMLTSVASVTVEDSPDWCATQFWLGVLTVVASDVTASFAHLTAARDALGRDAPTPLLVRTLAYRSLCLAYLGQLPQAAAEGRQALSMARELHDREGEAYALVWLGLTRLYARDLQGSLAWLRQVQKLDGDPVPGWVFRECAILMAIILADAGAVTEAQRYCADALAMARQAGSLVDQGEPLRVMADLDVLAGRLPEARAHLREAIELCSRTGYGVVLIDCLDSCGYLCAATARWAEAVTMWEACTSALRAAGMRGELPHGDERRAQTLRNARQALGPVAARAAEDRGAAMNLGTATQYALLLVTEQRGEAAGVVGVPQLSPRERELVSLVAQGRSNTEIAAQLCISVRTVGSHLDRIRDKTGCRRRADLTRLALRAGLI
jgi:predicted ATPase/DNA-binding CsgD family transcriptional regulator/transcriptional regulator with XRE-family HTH domain